MPRFRQFWIIVHRWAGLTIAAFLIVAGATGAILPWNEELTAATDRYAHVAPPYLDAPLLDPLVTNERAARQLPDAELDGLRLDVEPGKALHLRPAAKAGRNIDYDFVAVDPYTGAVLHRGTYGDLGDGWGQLVPFIIRLHYSLVAGDWGKWAFGIAALIWTLDCFVGFFLTLPIRRSGNVPLSKHQASWWVRWRPSWMIRRRARSYKLNFDLHRAGGLWLWPLLLVFAWSSVGMNLSLVYDPVMRSLGAAYLNASFPDRPSRTGYQPDWRSALGRARALSQAEGERRGFAVTAEHSLYFDREKDVYSYNFRSNRDFTDRYGWSVLGFRPDGKLAGMSIADGGLRGGGANNWLMALHMTNVGGVAYRIFVSILGLAVTGLSVTGVVIWMRRRSARLLGAKRARRLVQASSLNLIAAE